MLIKNNTGGDLGLEPGVVVPAGQTVDIDPDTFKRCEASPVVQGWLDSGAITAKKPRATKQAKKDNAE